MMNIGTIALASKVTVYVPSTTNTNSKANTTAHVNATASLLSKLFGGATSTPTTGYWIAAQQGWSKRRAQWCSRTVQKRAWKPASTKWLSTATR